jgi:phosphatidylglycerophosphate synthase
MVTRKKTLFTVPNILSMSRIAAVPVLVLLLILGFKWIFFVLYIIAGITDFFDGMAARILKQHSEIGKALDAWADLIFLMATAVYMYLWFPEYLKPNMWLLIVLLVFLVVSVLIGVIKFKKPVLMHTYLMKVNCWGVIIFFALSFFFDTTFLVTLVIVSYYLGFLETTIIYLLVDVDDIDPDTPSIVSIIGKKKGKEEEEEMETGKEKEKGTEKDKKGKKKGKRKEGKKIAKKEK